MGRSNEEKQKQNKSGKTQKEEEVTGIEKK